MITSGVPDPYSGGGALTAHTVIGHLLDRGDEVAVVALARPLVDAAGSSDDDRALPLRESGVPVTIVATDQVGEHALRGRLSRALSPRTAETYPEVAAAPRVAQAVQSFEPQAAFVYHFEALAATVGLAVPRLAAVGDPAHLPLYYRWRESQGAAAVRSLPRTLSGMRARLLAMRELMVVCARSGAFAAHHASWFRSRVVVGCEYIRTPVPWVPRTAGRALASAARPRILLLGHLKGVVTRSGLQLLARMLPALDAGWGPDGYEVRIVGGYLADDPLTRRLDHPAVTFAGHTVSPGEEIDAANVFLVPNPIDLGVRVRIITAAARGSAIVSHRANAAGIPELGSGRNCLLGDGPDSLAAAVARVVSDTELAERISSGARRMYEESFSPGAAGEAIARRLEEIALR